LLMFLHLTILTVIPYTTLFRSSAKQVVFFFDRPIKSLGTATVTTDTNPPSATSAGGKISGDGKAITVDISGLKPGGYVLAAAFRDRKSTRLNSSNEWISYAVFC